MKGRVVLLDHVQGREAAALVVDGAVEDLLLASGAPAPGTIYRARATRPVKGQGGMFVETPDGSGFLRQVKGLAPGATLLVQVTGYAELGKAVPVTTKILFKSRYAIVTPHAPGLNVSRQIRDEAVRDDILELAHEGMQGSAFGLILRSTCAGADADEIAEDIERTRGLAEAVMTDASGGPDTLVDGDGPHVLTWREWGQPDEVVSDEGAFERFGVLDRIDSMKGSPGPPSSAST